jgi:hypothetical protein
MTCGLQMRIAYTGLIYRKVREKNSFSFDNLNYTLFKDASFIESYNE